MEPKPKILIVDGSQGVTGANKSIITVTNELKGSFDFYYALSIHSSNKSLEPKKHYFHFVELSKNIKAILFYIPMLIINGVKLIKIVNNNSIQILHINDIYNMLGVFVKLFNPKIILIYHVRLLPNSYISSLYNMFSFFIKTCSDHIICVSKTVHRNFANQNNASIIYDAIPKIKKTKKIIKKDQTSILYLANYSQGKGQEYAIEAFGKAIKRIHGLSLTFIGGHLNNANNIVFKNQLRDLAEARGCANHVNFQELTDSPIERLFNADITLNFSDSESFSLTTLESISVGTPCIATNSGGPSEIIEDGISGMLVPCKDIEAMTNSLVELCSSSELQIKLSKNGIKRANKVFDLQKSSNKLNEIYNGLLI